MVEDAVDVRKESHVEHPVRLVEHEVFNPASFAYGNRKWSRRRPGVAMTKSTPLRRACSWGDMPTPP